MNTELKVAYRVALSYHPGTESVDGKSVEFVSRIIQP